MPQVENIFNENLVSGINTVGVFSPEDIFYPNYRGFLYTVDEINSFSNNTMTVNGEPSEPVAVILDSHNGKPAKSSSKNAVQTNLSRMPVMGSLPVTGTRNLIPFSNKMDSSPWQTVLVTPSTIGGIFVSPEETFENQTIYNFVGDGQGEMYLLSPATDIVKSQGINQYTASFYYKKEANGNFVNNFTFLISYNENIISVRLNPNQSTFEVFDGVATCTISDIDSEWARFSATITAPNDTVSLQLAFGYNYPIVSVTPTSELSNIQITMPQLEKGPIATRYQDTKNEIYARDFYQKNYNFVKFDSIDDTMNTNTADLNGTEGTIFVAGKKASYMLPYNMKTSTFSMGPNNFTNGFFNTIKNTEGVYGWGYINKKVSKEEADRLFEYYANMGASTNYSYPYQYNVFNELSETNSKIFWPSPSYWFTDINGTNNVVNPGDTINRWNSMGTDFFTQSNAGFAPRAAYMPIGSSIRNLFVGEDLTGKWLPTRVGGSAVNIPVITNGHHFINNNFASVVNVKFALSGSTSKSRLYMNPTWINNFLTTGQTYTFSFYAKSATNLPQTIQFGRVQDDPSYENINLTTEWKKFTYTLTRSASTALEFYIATTTTPTTNSADVMITKMQMELGSVATDYQKRVSAYEIYELGKASRWFALFDGINDFMTSNVALNISTTTQYQFMFSGMKYATTNVFGNYLFTGELNNHVALLAPNDAANNYAARFTKGGVINTIDTLSSGYASPHIFINTITANTTSQTATLRVNRQLRTTTSMTISGGISNGLMYLGSAGPHMVGYYNGLMGPFVITTGSNYSTQRLNYIETQISNYMEK